MKLLTNLPAPLWYFSKDGHMQPSHITIPQLVGPELPIITHNLTSASKMLCVHFSPAGNYSTYIEQMLQKGLGWVDALRTKPVSRHDTWLSFYFQLFPGMFWGLVTICMLPKKFNTKIQQLYKKALHYLGVNCKIKHEWRTLPDMYQELGMPNMPLISQSKKTSFLLGNWGFPGQVHSDALAMLSKNFLIKVGLYRSPLQWSYTEYGHLATNTTWFINL
jgi:hypothetical protein